MTLLRLVFVHFKRFSKQVYSTSYSSFSVLKPAKARTTVYFNKAVGFTFKSFTLSVANFQSWPTLPCSLSDQQCMTQCMTWSGKIAAPSVFWKKENPPAGGLAEQSVERQRWRRSCRVGTKRANAPLHTAETQQGPAQIGSALSSRAGLFFFFCLDRYPLCLQWSCFLSQLPDLLDHFASLRQSSVLLTGWSVVCTEKLSESVGKRSACCTHGVACVPVRDGWGVGKPRWWRGGELSDRQNSPVIFERSNKSVERLMFPMLTGSISRLLSIFWSGTPE